MVCAIGAEALMVPACSKFKRFRPFRSAKARCPTVRAGQAPAVDEPVSRRQALQGLALLAAGATLPLQASAAGKSAEVGRQVALTEGLIIRYMSALSSESLHHSSIV